MRLNEDGNDSEPVSNDAMFGNVYKEREILFRIRMVEV